MYPKTVLACYKLEFFLMSTLYILLDVDYILKQMLQVPPRQLAHVVRALANTVGACERIRFDS